MEALGRKVRAKSMAAKKKRREIVVFNAKDKQQDDTTNNKKRSRNNNKTTSFASPRITKKKVTLTKRRRTTKTTQYSNKRQQQQSNETNNNRNNIDTWVPDIVHLQQLLEETKKEDETTKNDRSSLPSNIVRVHGLPIGITKSSHIRKFFSGLDPERIFVLPTNPVTISTWDAAAADTPPPPKGKRQERHENHFRLFVQFSSAPVASLACERSGETLFFGSAAPEDDTAVDQKKKIIGASIAVSQVPKSVASFLQNRMAIDVIPGSSIESILTKCEKHLPSLVPSILWTTLAVRKLNIAQQQDDNDDKPLSFCLGEELEYEPLLESATIKRNNNNNNNKTQQLSQMIQCHNKLVDDYETLMKYISFFPVIDPEVLAQDPILRLTDNAIHCLLDEIEYLQEKIQIHKTLYNNNP